MGWWEEWDKAKKPPKRQPDHGADGPSGHGCDLAVVIPALAVFGLVRLVRRRRS